MKYTVSNTINSSLDKVHKKFIEPEGALNWMEGLVRIDKKSCKYYTRLNQVLCHINLIYNMYLSTMCYLIPINWVIKAKVFPYYFHIECF